MTLAAPWWRRLWDELARLVEPTALATVSAVSAVLFGVDLLAEDATSFQTSAVWDGPRGLVPLNVWGGAMLALGLLILAFRSGPVTRWPLALLAAVWAVFAASWAYVGLGPRASMAGAIAFGTVAAFTGLAAIAHRER